MTTVELHPLVARPGLLGALLYHSGTNGTRVTSILTLGLTGYRLDSSSGTRGDEYFASRSNRGLVLSAEGHELTIALVWGTLDVAHAHVSLEVAWSDHLGLCFSSMLLS